MERIHFLVVPILLMHLASSTDVANNDELLPNTSTDFLASYACNHASGVPLLENNEDGYTGNDSFYRWVLSARHTTWHPAGWEIDMPRPRLVVNNNSSNDVMMEEVDGDGDSSNNKYYARVFDLLNWSRKHNLLPVPIGISSICHKGMESTPTIMNDGINNNWSDKVPPKPNAYIPTESWSNLWNVCHKQLLSPTRGISSSSSTCIGIPGIVVESPYPPLKVNNPCHLRYRMVDGAHRLCLRKYLLTLLSGELMELEAELLVKGDSDDDKSITYDNNSNLCFQKIQQKQKLINQTAHGVFIVLNQTTFQSMLMNSDPHTSWAKDKQYLMKDVTVELRLDWKKWMGVVMDRVGDDECSDSSDIERDAAEPKEEL